MGKYFSRDMLIALVGFLAVMFGWNGEFQTEIINAVLMAAGSIAMLQDTARRAWGNSEEG